MKVFIVGSVGSGKTTLAMKLSKALAISWQELDTIVYDDNKPNREKRSVDDIHRIIEQINKQEHWILEGVHRESYAQLYELADIIILLNPPYIKRKYYIVKRYIKQQIGVEASHYSSTLEMLLDMLKWSHQFNKQKKKIEAEIKPNLHKLLVIRKQPSIKTILKKMEHYKVAQ